MFQLNEQEYKCLVSQNAIPKRLYLRSQFATSNKKGGRRYLPFVFTEQGVAMLSAVLRSDTAVKMSIQIMKAFITIRRFIATNAEVFRRLDTLEIKQTETDKKINTVLNAIESKEIQPKQGVFYDGQTIILGLL